MAARDADGGTGSARRRRERRLRSWAKHERLSVAMALAEKLHHSANRTVSPKKDDVEQHHALRGQPGQGPPRSTFSLAACACRSQWGSLSCRLGFSGTPWSRGSSTRRTCRSWALLRRRWRTSCGMCSGPWTARLLSRLSKCPNCRVLRVLPVRLVWNRRWRHSWLKCRLCCRMPCSSSGMWSKSSTLQFRLVVVVVVFKILSLHRVQQRPVLSRSLTVLLEVFKVFLPDMSPHSVLRSRTSTFLFLAHALMVVLKVFLPDRVPHSVLWRRTTIFQLPVLVPVVVFPLDRVCCAQWSRSSIFPFLARVMVEVFLVFTLNRVPQLAVELMPG